MGVGLAAIKISVLLFYRRIFVTKSFRRRVDAFVIVLIGWGISTVFVSGRTSESMEMRANIKSTTGTTVQRETNQWSMGSHEEPAAVQLLGICISRCVHESHI